jgi:hypothetical protein
MKSALAVTFAAALIFGSAATAAAAPPGRDAASVGHVWVGSSGGSGGDGTSWTDPANWRPATVPGPRDAALIDGRGATCQASVRDVPPDTVLARLVISQQDGCVASIGGGSLAVTKALAWVSGVIATDLTIPVGSHATFSAAADRDLTGSLTVAGTVTLDQATVTVQRSDGLTIVDGGHLRGSGQITGSVVNAGGTVSPGPTDDGPKLSVTGDYVQLATGTLQFHLPGAFTALLVGGTATIRGRVVYHTTDAYPSPPYGVRQLLILAGDLAWNPSCRTSTGPYRDVGFWFSIPGHEASGLWFMKVRFKAGDGHVC